MIFLNIDIDGYKRALTLNSKYELKLASDVAKVHLDDADLQNDWVNYGDGFEQVGYYRKNNTVKLVGAMKDGDDGDDKVVFTLPESCRPKYKKTFICADGGGGMSVNAGFIIEPDGDVIVYQVGSNGFVSLENIMFEVD